VAVSAASDPGFTPPPQPPSNSAVASDIIINFLIAPSPLSNALLHIDLD
jgi:hypothetical protein